MKKSFYFALPLLIASISPALADSGNMKISTVKNMYNDTIKLNRKNQDIDNLDTLFKYADKSLQNAVALSNMNRMGEDQQEDEYTECHDAFEEFKFGVGNGRGLEEAKSISYKLLTNDRVRASINYTGKDNINSSKFENYVDYSLKCTGSSCKITDMYHANSSFSKSYVDKVCR